MALAMAPSFAVAAGAQMAVAYTYMKDDRAVDGGLLHRAGLDAMLQGGKAGDTALVHTKAVQEFYRARNNQSFWMGGWSLYSRAERMYKTIDESWTHGLNPFRYHYKEIYALMGKKDAESRAALELLLTDAFIRYARDLSGKRVDVRFEALDNNSWKQRITEEQAAQVLAQYGSDFDEALARVEPQGQTYKALRQELVRLVEDGPAENEALLPIRLNTTLKPGMGHEAIPAIRAYLGLRQPDYNQSYYDEALAEAVIRFQKNAHLDTDAVIGAATVQAMNRTNMGKIEQVVVNLERLRWVDTNRGDKFVIVNIPSATLWAVKDGRVAFEMPVVVGTPDRPTISFTTMITGVRLNPDWTVPPTIKKMDILPKLIANPDYLADKGMELIRGQGADAQTLDPHSIDWSAISSAELQSIRMVQIPGDHNPLGRYRILMPNRYDIYLHDTNHPELFEKYDRTLSSGCVRMKYPREMVDFLLDEGGAQGAGGRTDRILASNKKTDLALGRAVPVSLLYYTVWLKDDGDVVYGNDIYGVDPLLLRALSSVDGVFVPVHNERNAGG